MFLTTLYWPENSYSHVRKRLTFPICILCLLWYDDTMKKATTTKSKTVAARKKASPMKRKAVQSEPEMMEENESVVMENGEVTTASASSRRLMLIAVGVIAVIALLGYRYKNLLTPAVVNGEPIYIWEYASALNSQFGSDQLNAMATEKVIDQEVSKANVSVSNDEIDKELNEIDKQASASGGVQAIAEAQNMTIDEFKERIKLQLSVKKILQDKITVSDQEINESFTKNKDFYKSVSEAEAKETIKKQLEEQKFQTEASSWLSGIRESAKIEILFPGL